MESIQHIGERPAKWGRLPVALQATRFFIGPETTSTSQKQSSENAQSTVGDVGAGAVAISTGANGSTDLSINEQNVDPALVESLGNTIQSVANTAITGNTVTATTAINAGTTDTLAALGFGAEVVTSSNNTLNNVVNQLATVSEQGQAEAQSAAFQAQLEAGQIGNDLAQIVANTVPQSVGAESELTNGQTPIQPQSVVTNGTVTSTATNQLNNLETWAVIIASGFGIWAFLRSKGKNT